MNGRDGCQDDTAHRRKQTIYAITLTTPRGPCVCYAACLGNRRPCGSRAQTQATHARDAIYQYLTAVFELVAWWAQEGRAVDRAHRALHLRGYSTVRQPEPFAVVIYCTADRDKVDDRTRSKWSRVLRYAAEFKDLDEPLRDFIKRRGGINKCSSAWATSSKSWLPRQNR